MSDTPTTPDSSPKAPQKDERQQARRQRSVIYYIGILFIVAFLLLLLSFMMERRQHAEDLDDLNASLSGLKDSVSAMQSVQQIQEENAELKQKQIILENQIIAGTHENAELKEQTLNQEKGLQAMDWFWQINEAFVRGRTSQCRQLIEEMEAAGLADYLPKESITDNGRFSPYDRLMEIRNRVIR